MKKLLTLFAILLLTMVTMAQTSKINFQAVVRDANNRLVTNTAVTVDVTVTYGSNTYTETNIAATTNANGLLSLTIGNGTGFDAIDWSNATIKTTVHNGSETLTSEVPVTAVPYALRANYSDVDPTHPTIIAIYNKMAADSTLLAGGIKNLTTKQKSDSTALAGRITDLNTTLSGKMKADSTTLRAALADTASALRNIIPTKTSALTNDANFVNNTACNTLTFCGLVNSLTELKTTQESIKAAIDSLKDATSKIQDKLSVPTVTTSEVSKISSIGATLAGNLVLEGITAVSERGFCYSTTETPTIEGTHVAVDGTGTGSFTKDITGLAANTTYYVRAYATSGGGTGYGEDVQFTTAKDGDPCPGAITVKDTDNNIYNTLIIGNQCWMKENLRTTKYADGTSIAHGGSNTSTTVAYLYYPNNSSDNVNTYGYLYNLKAVMGSSSSSEANPSGVQGICPNGWHVPSNAEWTQLSDYLSSQSNYVCENDTAIAKALASTTGWNSSTTTCAVGNNPNDNNATGFSAPPAGQFAAVDPVKYANFGIGATFWTATARNDTNEYVLRIRTNSASVISGNNKKGYGLSVRCVRD